MELEWQKQGSLPCFFMNGRIDLSQAESIADLIASENEASRK